MSAQPQRATQSPLADKIRTIVEIFIREMVDHPEHVEVHILQTRSSVTVEVKVRHREYGQAVGAGGRHVRPLEQMIAVLCSRHAVKFNHITVFDQPPRPEVYIVGSSGRHERRR